MKTLLVGLVLLAGTAQGANVHVQVGGTGLIFSPQTTTIRPGDTVTFNNLGGFHNVVADNGAFHCARGCTNDGHGGNGAPSSSAWQATLAFPREGTFGYFCEAHGTPGTGMYGTIIVQAPAPVVLETGASSVPATGVIGAAALAVAVMLTARARLRRRALRTRSVSDTC
jgi:plastocyanin